MASGAPTNNNGGKLSHSTWHPPRSPAPVSQEGSSPQDGARALHHSSEGASRSRLRKKPSFNMKVCDFARELLLLRHDISFLLSTLKDKAFTYVRNRYYGHNTILLLSVLCTARFTIGLITSPFCVRHLPCFFAAF